MTALDMPHMSATSARESVERARTHLEAAAEEVVRQINGRAWLALGYDSWDEMREAEYRGAAVIVPRADRPELVAKLRAEGLSQREIGDTIGVSEATVSRNLQTKDTDQPETRTDSLGRERPTTYTPRARDLPQADPPAVEDSAVPAPSAPALETCCDGKGEHLPGCPELAGSFSDEQISNAVAGTSAEYRDAQYRKNLSKHVRDAQALSQHDPARVVEVGDALTFEVIDNAARSIAAWHEQISKLRSRPLRVVDGGRA